MQKYADVVTNADGNTIAGASIKVNIQGGGTATIYSDNGTTTISNPIVTTGNGAFSFYAANGTYQVVITKPDNIVVTRNNLILSDKNYSPAQLPTSQLVTAALDQNGFVTGLVGPNSQPITLSGSGSVTSVSVTTANGVSGSVSNPTTTPAISLTLGAITPSSVASTGSVSGTTLASTVATGTAPFTVASTTPVANLSIGGNAATATTATTAASATTATTASTATTANSATTATTASNIAAGLANQLAYQSAANTTAFATAPTTSGTYLEWNGSAFAWVNPATQNITVGPYATVASLTAAYPASTSTGIIGVVGSAAPYTQYVSSGSAWVPVITAITNSTGQVTGLAGPGGGQAQFSYFTYVQVVKSWMTSQPGITMSAWAYTPTIFYDPSYVGASTFGTQSNPYNTPAQIQKVCSGNMTGQVLGIKCGTTSPPLNLTCYGSAAAPFIITSYSSGAAPIITGQSVSTSWVPYAGDNTIFQMTGLTYASDVFIVSGSDYARLYPVTGANLAAKIAALQSYRASPVANTLGACTFDTGAMYCYINGSINAVTAGAVISTSASSLSITYPNSTGSAGIRVVGLDIRFSLDSALSIHPPSYAGTGTLAPIHVIGNRVSHAGSRLMQIQGSPAFSASDAILVSGASSTLLAQPYIACNEIFDAVNNAVELNNTSGGIIERNYSNEIGGNAVAELYAVNSNTIVRFNRGQGMVVPNSIMGVPYSGSGVWFGSFSDITGVAYNTALNTNNLAEYNFTKDIDVWHYKIGGSNNTVRQNSMVMQNRFGFFFRFGGGNTATGNRADQNICYVATSHFVVYIRMDLGGLDGTTSATYAPYPTMTKNAYLQPTDGLGGNFQFDYLPASGTSNLSQYNLAGWQSVSGTDTGSLSNSSGGTTTASFNLTLGTSALMPGLSMLAVGGTSSLRASGSQLSLLTWDIEANPVAIATPNIGAYQG